jgi:hypothetical protein
MTPEAAAALIERWPDLAENSLPCRQAMARDIRRAFKQALTAAAPQDRMARYFPSAGVTEAFFKQGLLPSGAWHERIFQRLDRWLGRNILGALGDRPGVNDFYIVQWLILRDPAIAAILYRRQSHPSLDIATSCSWALESLAERFPDLAQHLREAHLRAWAVGKALGQQVRQPQ